MIASLGFKSPGLHSRNAGSSCPREAGAGGPFLFGTCVGCPHVQWGGSRFAGDVGGWVRPCRQLRALPPAAGCGHCRWLRAAGRGALAPAAGRGALAPAAGRGALAPAAGRGALPPAAGRGALPPAAGCGLRALPLAAGFAAGFAVGQVAAVGGAGPARRRWCAGPAAKGDYVGRTTIIGGMGTPWGDSVGSSGAGSQSRPRGSGPMPSSWPRRGSPSATWTA